MPHAPRPGPESVARRRWWLFVGVTAVILVAVLIPGSSVPSVGVSGLDLLVHALLFAAWAVALLRASEAVARRPWLAVVAAAGFALTTESMQLLAQQRSFDVRDIAADVAGALLATAVTVVIRRSG